MRLLLLAALLASASPASAQGVTRWRHHVVEASGRFGVPVAWIEAVMRAESAGRTHQNGRLIRSRAGAMGLMQLMPGTWAQMRSRLGLGANPDDPRDNILAGTFYLRLMYDRFGYPGLFGAYNAGPGRYAEHLKGRKLPAETVGYLASVAPSSTGPAHAQGRPPQPPPSIFAVRKDVQAIAPAGAKPPAGSSLFVALSKQD